MPEGLGLAKACSRMRVSQSRNPASLFGARDSPCRSAARVRRAGHCAGRRRWSSSIRTSRIRWLYSASRSRRLRQARPRSAEMSRDEHQNRPCADPPSGGSQGQVAGRERPHPHGRGQGLPVEDDRRLPDSPSIAELAPSSWRAISSQGREVSSTSTSPTRCVRSRIEARYPWWIVLLARLDDPFHVCLPWDLPNASQPFACPFGYKKQSPCVIERA